MTIWTRVKTLGRQTEHGASKEKNLEVTEENSDVRLSITMEMFSVLFNTVACLVKYSWNIIGNEFSFDFN